MSDSEFEKLLTGGKAHWLIAFNHDLNARTLAIDLTSAPDDPQVDRRLRCTEVTFVHSRWHDRDDTCLEALIGAHQLQRDSGYCYLFVTDQREIQVMTPHEATVAA